MLFDSPIYVVFLICVVLVYWRLGWRTQNLFLLGASYFFYGWWDWRFLGLMILSTTMDFLIAQSIADSTDARRRKTLLIFSLALNFGFLGFFKYFNFFVDSVAGTVDWMGIKHAAWPVLRVLLPPGISFYTFQEVAYVVDVYHGKQEPCRSFRDYALFVSLFPHLIAGPIQRPSHLLGQVQRPRHFDSASFYNGLMLIVLGMFRKCVFADNFATIANAAFDGRLGHNAGASSIGAIAFAFQIYGDFSGYTDIARGSAQLLGFHFVVNFRRPYLATSLQDFWRRWHISLSTWLRDYLYIPLGGNRKGRMRTYLNLLVTMILGGLWHGANWTFVIWGAIHGMGLAIERFVSEERGTRETAGTGSWTGRIVTLSVVCIAWIFFRAENAGHALAMIRDFSVWHWEAQAAAPAVYLAVLGGCLLLMDWALEQSDDEYLFERRPRLAPVAAFVLIVLTAAFGAMDSNAFIYFQF